MGLTAFDLNISSGLFFCKRKDTSANSCKMMFCFTMRKRYVLLSMPGNRKKTTMVRSALLLPTATFGRIELMVSIYATLTSVATTPM
jgi:hypothetical protein